MAAAVSEPLTVAVLYGSARPQRTGIRAVKYIAGLLESHGHQPIVLDVCEADMGLLTYRYSDYGDGEAPAWLTRWAETLTNADAVVAVAGEYNQGIQPGLKSLFDHFLKEWRYKVSGIVSYSAGPYGGNRAAGYVRFLLGELGCPAIPTTLRIAHHTQRLDEAGILNDAALAERGEGFVAELAWYADAVRAKKARDGLPG